MSRKLCSAEVRGASAWWDGAEPLAVMRVGINVRTGRQSILEIYPILALRCFASVNLVEVPPVFTAEKCHGINKFRCGYCAEVFAEAELTIDHIVPARRGGPLNWLNTCSACRDCNSRKRDRTLEEAGMLLVYLPYATSRFEASFAKGEKLRYEVHEWLSARLPKGSRSSQPRRGLSRNRGAFFFSQLKKPA